MFSRASNAFAAAVAPAVEPASEQIGASGEDNVRDASGAISLNEADLTGFGIGTMLCEYRIPEDLLPEEAEATLDGNSTEEAQQLSGADLARAALNVDGDEGAPTAQEEKINQELENHSRGRHAGQSTLPQTPPSLTVKKVATPPATEKSTMDANATPSRRSQRAQSQQAQASPSAPSSVKKQDKPSSATEISKKEPTTGEKRKRGRPSKAPEESDGTQATKRTKVSETGTPRRRGRPPKTGTTPASVKKATTTPGRGRGRPRKSEGPASEKKPKVLNPDGTPRGRGRPRKSEGAIAAKKTTTPLKKTSTATANGTSGRGRPRKSDAANAAPKTTSPVSEKKTNEPAESVPNSPGRPKKAALKKEASAETNGTPKRRGRPRKSE